MVIDEDARRRDAEAALASFYHRVIELEHQLNETRSDARAVQSEAIAERDGTRARNEELEVDLAAARAELTEERRARYEAQANLRRIEQTKTFRLARIPRKIYSILRGP